MCAGRPYLKFETPLGRGLLAGALLRLLQAVGLDDAPLVRVLAPRLLAPALVEHEGVARELGRHRAAALGVVRGRSVVRVALRAAHGRLGRRRRRAPRRAARRAGRRVLQVTARHRARGAVPGWRLGGCLACGRAPAPSGRDAHATATAWRARHVVVVVVVRLLLLRRHVWRLPRLAARAPLGPGASGPTAGVKVHVGRRGPLLLALVATLGIREETAPLAAAHHLAQRRGKRAVPQHVRDVRIEQSGHHVDGVAHVQVPLLVHALDGLAKHRLEVRDVLQVAAREHLLTRRLDELQRVRRGGLDHERQDALARLARPDEADVVKVLARLAHDCRDGSGAIEVGRDVADGRQAGRVVLRRLGDGHRDIVRREPEGRRLAAELRLRPKRTHAERQQRQGTHGDAPPRQRQLSNPTHGEPS